MRFTEDCGKLKFDKGSLCNIMCSSERFREHGMVWRYLRYRYSWDSVTKSYQRWLVKLFIITNIFLCWRKCICFWNLPHFKRIYHANGPSWKHYMAVCSVQAIPRFRAPVMNYPLGSAIIDVINSWDQFSCNNLLHSKSRRWYLIFRRELRSGR